MLGGVGRRYGQLGAVLDERIAPHWLCTCQGKCWESGSRGVAEGLGAGGAGADGSKMVIAVDAGGVAVGEGELDGVVAYGIGGFGGGLGFEHREGRGGGWAGGSEVGFFLALVVAGSAGAFFS